MRQVRIDAATGQSPGPVLQADLLPLAGHLGTSLGAVDAAGQVQEAVATDAFGQPRIPGSHSNPGGFTSAPAGGWQQSHLFAGEYWDQDSQLLYLRARWYDPQIGRFISADPFEGRQRDPKSLNRYTYAHSDPVHTRDPSGMFGVGELMTGLQILGNVATRAISLYQLFDKVETTLTIAQIAMQLKVIAGVVPVRQILAKAATDTEFMDALANSDAAVAALASNTIGIIRHLSLDVDGREKLRQFLANPNNNLLFYGPTPQRTTPWPSTGMYRPQVGSITTGKVNRKIMVEFGRSSGQGGRMFGLGHTQGSGSNARHRQWFRMD